MSTLESWRQQQQPQHLQLQLKDQELPNEGPAGSRLQVGSRPQRFGGEMGGSGVLDSRQTGEPHASRIFSESGINLTGSIPGHQGGRRGHWGRGGGIGSRGGGGRGGRGRRNSAPPLASGGAVGGGAGAQYQRQAVAQGQWGGMGAGEGLGRRGGEVRGGYVAEGGILDLEIGGVVLPLNHSLRGGRSGGGGGGGGGEVWGAASSGMVARQGAGYDGGHMAPAAGGQGSVPPQHYSGTAAAAGNVDPAGAGATRNPDDRQRPKAAMDADIESCLDGIDTVAQAIKVWTWRKIMMPPFMTLYLHVSS